jgi:hypothetical protein
MKSSLIITFICVTWVLSTSCSSSYPVWEQKRIKLSLQAGGNTGGITENTDMSVVPGVEVPAEATVDAFSGATYTGANLGVHLNKTLKRNQVELGLDYMYNHQNFNYIDIGNHFIGVRELNVSQCMIPLTYNFVLFRKWFPLADVQIKMGYLGQFNFVTVTETGILPEYRIKPWSNGVTLGVSAFPFCFRNGNKLGFYFDGYRGTQVYEDFYNQKSFEMPGSSFIRFGLKFQFNGKKQNEK